MSQRTAPQSTGMAERVRDVRYEYEKKVEDYERRKLSGNLTKDWGESALIHAREMLRWIVYIETGRWND
jgi:hypothetical protein